jgi:gliding motility-associated protein GldE
LSPSDKHDVSENNNSTDHIIDEMLDHQNYLYTTILILNSLISISVIILGFYAMNLFINFSGSGILFFLIEVIILASLLLFFGNVLPQAYAKKNPLNYCRKTAPIINAFEHFCRPLSITIVKSTYNLNKIFRKKQDLSVKDLSMALELSSDEISEEKEMLEGIIKLYNTTAVEIMTSRLDVVYVDIKLNFRKLIEFIVDTGYSRIPVYSENQDDIKGILYIKDLLPYLNKPANFRWQSLIRPAYFVPETKKIDDLLDEFKKNRIHFSVVVDEFGGTSGIVTLEDILEEIVGEIDDEYDEVESKYIQLEDGSYVFEAKILLTDFFKATGLDSKDFGKLTDEADSLAGLILELKGDFPEQKEILEYNDYAFQVLDVNKRRILKVRFFVKTPNTIVEEIEK